MTTVIAEASPRVIFTSNLLTIGSKRSISRLEMKNMNAKVGKNQKKDKSAIVENARKNDVLYLYHNEITSYIRIWKMFFFLIKIIHYKDYTL